MSSGNRMSLESAELLARSTMAKITGTRILGKVYLTTAKWEIAGSIRRKRDTVGDIEIVAIPMYQQGRNLLWDHLDKMFLEGLIQRAMKINKKDPQKPPATRWGAAYRAFCFPEMPDFHIEIFSADRDNFGLQLGIRTGSWEYNKALMSKIKHGGKYRVQDGYLREADMDFQKGQGIIGEMISCPTEAEYFAAAGIKPPPSEHREVR